MAQNVLDEQQNSATDKFSTSLKPNKREIDAVLKKVQLDTNREEFEQTVESKISAAEPVKIPEEYAQFLDREKKAKARAGVANGPSMRQSANERGKTPVEEMSKPARVVKQYEDLRNPDLDQEKAAAVPGRPTASDSINRALAAASSGSALQKNNQEPPETTRYDHLLPEEQQRDLGQQARGSILDQIQKNKLTAERVKVITKEANRLLDAELMQGVALVWAAAIPSIGGTILIGAVLGDLLWIFKNTLIRTILRPMLSTDSLKQQGDVIAQQIKISNKVKLNILGMNLVVLAVQLLVVLLVLLAICNTPAKFVTYFTGQSQMCQYVNISNIASVITGNPSSTINPPAGHVGNSACMFTNQGPASVANLSQSCFGPNAPEASAIAVAESGGIPTRLSGSDICADGSVASVGLFQINLTNHQIGGFDCPKAFSSQFTASDHSCRVIDQNLYQQCVAAAEDPSNNIAEACLISHNGASWNQWGANRKCGF